MVEDRSYDKSLLKSINFAVNRDHCDALITKISKMDPGNTLTLNLSKIPKGSPHHLDNTGEVMNYPHITFSILSLIVDEDTPFPVFVRTSGNVISMFITKQGKEKLFEAINLSKSSAYYLDNKVEAVVQVENQKPYDSEITVWTSTKDEIIYR